MTEDEYLEKVKADCAAGLRRWRRYLANTSSEQIERDTIRTVVEEARRRGVPVVRGEMRGGVIVLELATPAGHG